MPNALIQTYEPFPFVIDHGRGDRLWDTEGGEWIDFYGGHCVCSVGHSHPDLVSAISAQAEKLLFYSTAGKVEIRDHAADALIEFSDGVADRVFFCNTGAEANETALKLACRMTGRSKFASVEGGWHGRTTLAMSVTDDPAIRASLEEVLAPCDFLPLNDTEALNRFDFSQCAGVILEPIQSMSGIRVAEKDWVSALINKAHASGCMVIFDEVQTGIGRLGKPFAANVLGLKPDFITSAKGLASGFPMGAVLMSEDVAAQLKAPDLGSTFGGGPVACAAMMATLEIILRERLMDRTTEIEHRLRNELLGLRVTALRGQGLLLGIESKDAKALKSKLYADQILVGGSRDPNVLRLMPPLVLTDPSVIQLIYSVQAFQAVAV
ncbi:MAG: aminotransferase class III-fold pyridoxal phosphate-dependent enzyme [Armatimonadetes bacterium]|nr:aminotransferase class III-fold pyridoxal phosphate-dependent enzyme [Armatimonadota bacterium]